MRAASNPILSDGTDHTSDPAPLVAGGKLYILTKRDTASPQVNNFTMPGWQMPDLSGGPMARREKRYRICRGPDSVG